MPFDERVAMFWSATTCLSSVDLGSLHLLLSSVLPESEDASLSVTLALQKEYLL